MKELLNASGRVWLECEDKSDVTINVWLSLSMINLNYTSTWKRSDAVNVYSFSTFGAVNIEDIEPVVAYRSIIVTAA
jgi:hypothetical protein